MLVLNLTELSLWIICPAAILSFLSIYTFCKRMAYAGLGYPWAKTLPFLGDLPSTIKHGEMANQVIRLKKYGKFCAIFNGNTGFLSVADTEMIKQICVKEFASFPNRARFFKLPKYLQMSVTNASVEDWRFLRHTARPAFSTGKLKNMVPLIDKCLDTFVGCVLEKLEVSDTLDVSDLFHALTMDLICSTTLGIDVDSQHNPDDPFVKNVKGITNFSRRNVFALIISLFPEMGSILSKLGVQFFYEDAVEFLAAAIRDAMITRRKEGWAGHADALQVMLNSQAGNFDTHSDEEQLKRCMTDEEIISSAMAIMVAGSDTVAASLTFVAYCLATNPDVQELLVEEIQRELGSDRPDYDNIAGMQYLDMVISETLRLYPPIPTTNRRAIQDVQICGYRIRSGEAISIPIYAIHRLEEYWPNPDRFDPERFSPENKAKQNPYSYLPFGVGPRNCLGMRLALLKIKLAIITLLQHFRIGVSQKTQIPPKFSRSIFIKPANGMPLVFERIGKD